MHTYKVIGTMSGTSLDGLDIAFCTFEFANNQWQYSIKEGKTVPYSVELRNRLTNIENGTALELAQLNVDFGHFIGQEVHNFTQEGRLEVDFIASHGHTIYHQTDKKLTLQIGSGAAIATETCLPTICDFRTNDVALGGHGAPLVPIGDRLLFSDYNFCLNLGGIANISFEEAGNRIAFDICPINMALNPIAQQLGYSYDEGGKIAASGQLNEELLTALNALPFYRQTGPKSLGKEWYLAEFLPLVQQFDISPANKLKTICEHAAQQIVAISGVDVQKRVLVTGGGAYNSFFISCLERLAPSQFQVGSAELIDFKEALIFAFLGVLRHRQEINCLSTVTGASRDNIGGAIYHG